MHNTGMSVENYNANEFKFSPAEFIHIESVHNSSQLKAEIKVQQYQRAGKKKQESEDLL